MPRNPKAVRPRVKDARAYERALRQTYLDPMFRRMRKSLATAEGSTQAFRAMDTVVNGITARPNHGVPTREIQRAIDRIDGYHRKRVIQSFRAALGVDVAIFLAQPEIAALLAEKVSQNVDLIKTIPVRLHDALKTKLQEELAEATFDQKRLTRLVRQEFKSTGWNLRRIVRDQNSKTISGLSRVRQSQLGINRYVWRTSQDERVRPEHNANSGRAFEWADPPSETGHPGDDVMCFPGSVEIIPAGIHTSISYRYIGKVIEIRLADGINVTTTPNHPILTETGWKRADDIQEGDKLLHHFQRSRFTLSGSNPKFHNRNSIAEQLHSLLGGQVNPNGTNGRREDLHSHPARRNKEINIVSAPSELRNELDAMEIQVFGNLRLKPSNVSSVPLLRKSNSVSDLLCPTRISSLLVGSMGESSPIFRGGVIHSDRVGFRSTSRTDTQVPETRDHHSTTDSKFGRHLFDRLLRYPTSSNLGEKGTSSFKMSPVISRLVHSHSGPVYSFSSRNGLILANGIVTHNCRCLAEPLITQMDENRIKGFGAHSIIAA